ncbi:MAG: alpha/beta hydrolase [Pseudomonadales bacterium]
MQAEDAVPPLDGTQQATRSVARYAMQVQDFGRGPASWQYYAGPPGRTIHFAPANGMPAATYLFLLEALAKHGNVYSMDNRGAWPGIAAPGKSDSWWLHLDDFLAFARSQYREPIHYVGHSMGASVGLLAALRHPEMFASITMIDPGTVPNLALALMMRFAPERLKQRLRLISTTRKRRASWPSREAFLEYIATRSTYRNFTTRALQDYAYGGLQPCDEGFCLRFMPVWEAHNFKASVHVWPLMHKIKVPAVLVRGQHSNVFPVARYREIGKRLERASGRGKDPALWLVEVPGVGHMLPQEGPQQALDVVLSHWAQL